MADTIADAIGESAKAGVASATVDGNSMTAVDIAKQIEADRYLAANRAATKNHFGCYYVRLIPPGAG